MHELSVAKALFELVRSHAPQGACVRVVRVRVGPMQAIVPEALRYAWQAATNQTVLDGADLVVEYLPWRLSCVVCDRQWDSDEPYAPCTCGHHQPALSGSDELTLVAIDVDDAGAVASIAATDSDTGSEPSQPQESVR